MTAFPQYAKTSSEEVLDVMAQNRALDKAFFERGMAFAEAHGGTGFYSSRWGTVTSIVAIKADQKPTSGQWKKHPRGGWLPYKNNPLYAEFDAIEFRRNRIPGLPDTVESAFNGMGQHYIANPSPFVLDGEVFVGFSFVPQENGRLNQPSPEEGEWVEIKASEWHAAREAKLAENDKENKA
jgi:hypothetical protein